MSRVSDACRVAPAPSDSGQAVSQLSVVDRRDESVELADVSLRFNDARLGHSQVVNREMPSVRNFVSGLSPSPFDRFKVTILLATKNGGDFLADQLQSFDSQTHRNWELVVSDDGSTDATRDIIRKFAQNCPRPVYMRPGPCAGFWRNFLRLANDAEIRSDFYAFSDQDDIWLDDKLTRAVRWLSTVPQDKPALYCGRTELIDCHGKRLGYSRLFTKLPSFENALVQNIGGGNTMVFNEAARKLLKLAPGVEIVSHDWWLYQMVAGAGGLIHYDPEPCLKYRQHSRNLVGANRGLRARVMRLQAMLGGRMTTWNETNIQALRSVIDQLDPSSRLTLEYFALARKALLPRRLRLMRDAQIYRQHPIENLGMFAGVILGRI